MKLLERLAKKRLKLAVGLMSGTSADGIDAALVRIEGRGVKTKVRLIDFLTEPYPDGLREMILRNSQQHTGDVAEISQLNFLIATLSSELVKKLLSHSGVKRERIDFIGSHGHTIHHIPRPVDFFGHKVSSTLQIGDPSVIAKLTGVITVGDFRVGDVAVGGEGAPLVPFFDYIFFRSSSVTRGLLNIGGIANITHLPRRCDTDDVVAFDTGPGNMIIDQLTKMFYGTPFDDGGKIASSGRVHESVMEYLSTDDFISAPPPKSTGRERYGTEFVSRLVSKFNQHAPADMIASATDFTARSVYTNYERFLRKNGKIKELYVSGGGAHNPFMLASLERYFANTKVQTAEKIGMSSDAKEAICFAVLANETLSGNPANLPRVTGATRKTVLGKICLP